MQYKRLLYQSTAMFRVLPDFIVIGTMKSGTSSLYHYLGQHSNITMANKGEVHFFDKNHTKGQLWYRSFFPTKFTSANDRVGEVTPGYIFKDKIAPKVKALLPNVQMIVLMRNPVDRAYSHYQSMLRRYSHQVPFEEYLFENTKATDEFHRSKARQVLIRGNYGDQVEKWMRYFRKENFLFLESEEMYTTPNKTMQKTHAFLGLNHQELKDGKPKNVGGYETPMTDVVRERLNDYYKNSNNKLKALGLDFSWLK